MRAVSPKKPAEKPWWLLVQIVLPILGVVWLIQGAYAIHREALPQRTVMINAGGCHMPTTILDPPGGQPIGSAVVLHGLSANRRLMLYLGQNLTNAGIRVYIPDLPGHGDNTDPFSFARAEYCAAVAVESLTHSGQIDPKTTILVGHSMGAAIAIRLADRDPLAATIAISPAPTPMPQRMPANLLILSAQYDIGIVRREAGAISDAAGIDRTAAGDFAQDRAFQMETVPHATHTSMLFDPTVLTESLQWINQTLAGNFQGQGQEAPEMLSPGRSFQGFAGCLTGSANGLIGILVLFLPFVAIAGRIGGTPREESPIASRPSYAPALAEVAACAVATALLLRLVVPLKFLHIYSGDYLASLLLIVGIALLALNWGTVKESWSPSARHLIPAAVLGVGTFLAIGAWLNWQVDDTWLNSARWLRFAALLPIMYIFCFAEEVLLGPVRRGKLRALRYAVFLGLRLEIWLACLLAYYALASGQVLLPLLVVFFALFSALQRLATDALRRRTGSPEAAALFGAILAAWFIAAVLPLA
jgi:pimeloyl-ACP methyl ester carboxylesterase